MCIEHNDHNYSLKFDALKYNTNQLLPYVKQSDEIRGKFLDPCPDITIIHHRGQQEIVQKGIIQNGNKLAPVMFILL